MKVSAAMIEALMNESKDGFGNGTVQELANAMNCSRQRLVYHIRKIRGGEGIEYKFVLEIASGFAKLLHRTINVEDLLDKAKGPDLKGEHRARTP